MTARKIMLLASRHSYSTYMLSSKPALVTIHCSHGVGVKKGDKEGRVLEIGVYIGVKRR